MNLPNFPADRQVSDSSGQLKDGWWLFFSSIARWIRANQNSAQLITRTQAQLAALALTLKSNEAGLLVEVTDYRHILRWTGSAWEWGPGEDGRHDIVALPVDPDSTVGWQLCDGTATTYLKGDGTTGSYTTPNLVSTPAYLKLGTPVTGINAAVAPSFSGSATDPASTGITATTAASGSGNIIFPSGAGVLVTLDSLGHTHPVTITDPTHDHTLSGSVGDDGEPANIVMRPWFRR